MLKDSKTQPLWWRENYFTSKVNWNLWVKLSEYVCVVSFARGALHPLLHREQVHALHQVLQGYASVSQRAIQNLFNCATASSLWHHLPCVRVLRACVCVCVRLPVCVFLCMCVCVHALHRESRTHCIDIETAHMQGCEMLDQAVLVRELAQRAAQRWQK